MRRHFLLRTQTIEDVLDRHHLTHADFADHLGLSRSYWSQVVNRRRALSPAVRQCLIASRYLRGVAESALWDALDPAAA
jgi:hypothetical protein